VKLADFTEPFVLPIQHWSASSLNMLAICPRQWQARYIWNRKEAPGAARVLGRANHKTAEYNFMQKIATGEDLPVAELVEHFHDDAWPNSISDVGGASEVVWDDSPDEQLALGIKMVTAYRTNVMPRVEPAAVEQHFTLKIPELPIPLIGYIDVVQRDGRPIIDLKTSSKKRTTMKPDWRMQGRVYQLAYPRRVDWHVVTKAALPTTWTGLEEPGLMQEIERADKTRALIRQLSAQANHYLHVYGPDEDWPALGVAHDWRCNWCAYMSDCPAWTT
jgi:hypothetical protein